ncbi:hypothetical protein RUND412_000697 [Rhizina undulata]
MVDHHSTEGLSTVEDIPAATGTVESPPPPPPPPKDVPPKDRLYLDPAPLTPAPSRPGSPVASPLREDTPNKHQRSRSENSSDDDDVGEDTRNQIHNIFEQSNVGPVAEELQRATSPSLATSPEGFINDSIHPPKTSPLSESSNSKRPLSVVTQNPAVAAARASNKVPFTPVRTTPSLTLVPATPKNAPKPPPPDEDLPFDFHRFLGQLRHRSADPVAKFLRSFLNEFAKKQWMVHEQIKIIHDFLNFIYGKMEACEVWREVGEVEMDNAREGMEKLVMNRLYTQTFSPAIPSSMSTPNRRNVKDRERDDRFPGRRGQHQEDVERDEVLAQKVRIYGWIREEHLDIADTVVGEGGRKFLDLAVGELLKMGTYRAPRDKVICVLNCCKVIFGLLRHAKSDESADKFVPLLIYVVLRANPEHLVSNVNYIMRFRNAEKLGGEAGYYLSSLSGAISFIENLDRSSLTITDEEFEKSVEDAVAAIAERPPPSTPPRSDNFDRESISEKFRRGSATTPRGPTEQRDGRARINNEPTSPGNVESEEKQAVAGLLRTIQRPLTTIGRMFGDDPGAQSHAGPSSHPAGTPLPGNTPRHSPSTEDTLLTAVGGRRYPRDREKTAGSGTARPEGKKPSAEDSAARQAIAEAEEARRLQIMEHEKVVEVLQSMFPALDKDVIGDVVRLKEGRVGLAVDACLALSTGM